MAMVTPLDPSVTPKWSLRHLLCHVARVGMVVCIHGIPLPKFHSFHTGDKAPGAPGQLPVPFSSPGLGTMWGGQLYPRGSDGWVQSLLHREHHLCPAPLQSQHPRDPGGAVWGSLILKNSSASQAPSDTPPHPGHGAPLPVHSGTPRALCAFAYPCALPGSQSRRDQEGTRSPTCVIRQDTPAPQTTVTPQGIHPVPLLLQSTHPMPAAPAALPYAPAADPPAQPKKGHPKSREHSPGRDPSSEEEEGAESHESTGMRLDLAGGG